MAKQQRCHCNKSSSMSHIGALRSLKPNSDLEAKFLGKRRDAALHELGGKNATTNIRMLI